MFSLAVSLFLLTFHNVDSANSPPNFIIMLMDDVRFASVIFVNN